MKLNPCTFIVVTVVAVPFLMACSTSRESKPLTQAQNSQAIASSGPSSTADHSPAVKPKQSPTPAILIPNPVCKNLKLCLLFQMERDDEAVKNCGAQALLYLTIAQVDLNRDGKPEFLVKSSGPKLPTANSELERMASSGLCSLGSPKSNMLWIYRKVNADYQLMLREKRIKSVTPMKTYTNGYRDLKIVSVGWDPEVRKFDGNGYK